MVLPLLLDDALVPTDSGFALRVSLPWIRSMPLAAVTDIIVRVDGSLIPVTIRLDEREVEPVALPTEPGWWFIQDRLELRGERMLTPAAHDISVSFVLMVPYLQAAPSGPLCLPFRADRVLGLGDAASAHPNTTVGQTTVREPAGAPQDDAGDVWTVSASAFNWTPEVIRAESAADDIAIGVVADGVASTIEIEAGQVWRSFPEPSDTEADAFRERLAAAGGAVTIVGASLDDWISPTRRRTEQERLGFLMPQLRAAARLGARGVRVPFGQAGPELLRLAQPVLHELDVVLYEEIQGQQTLDVPANAANLELLQDLDDPRIRVLIDISLLMPSLPPSYLEALRRGGVAEEVVRRLETEWRAPETHSAVIATLREGRVPPAVHTLYMNLLVRFGRSDIADLEPLLPLTTGVHLKFWDLDDTDSRVSRPIGDIGTALKRTGFTGTLTSEWGGHEWLDADSAATTRAHIALAQRALSAVGVTD